MNTSRWLACCCAVLLAAGLMFAATNPCAAGEKRKPDAQSSKEKQPALNKALLTGGSTRSANAKIAKALETPTVIEFIETPLRDVVDYLKDFHRIEIQLDKRALENAGIGTDTPISRNLREITLCSALDLLLDEHDLSWIIEHEVLLITTKDAATAMRETCIYNLAPLVGDGSVDELAEVVRSSILSLEQRDEGADISIVPYRHVLVVRHNQRGQRQVAEFLEQLRTALTLDK